MTMKPRGCVRRMRTSNKLCSYKKNAELKDFVLVEFGSQTLAIVVQ